MVFQTPFADYVRVVLEDFHKTSKKNYFVCFDESPLKMMKNAFYLILKALFVLKIFQFSC